MTEVPRFRQEILETWVTSSGAENTVNRFLSLLNVQKHSFRRRVWMSSRLMPVGRDRDTMSHSVTVGRSAGAPWRQVIVIGNLRLQQNSSSNHPAPNSDGVLSSDQSVKTDGILSSGNFMFLMVCMICRMLLTS